MRRHRRARRPTCPGLKQRQNWVPLEAVARRVPLWERQAALKGRTGRRRRTAREFCLVVSFALPDNSAQAIARRGDQATCKWGGLRRNLQCLTREGLCASSKMLVKDCDKNFDYQPDVRSSGLLSEVSAYMQ